MPWSQADWSLNDDAKEEWEQLLEYFNDKVFDVQRSGDDILRRLSALQRAYQGQSFRRFQVEVKAAADLEAANNPSPKSSGKRPHHAASSASGSPQQSPSRYSGRNHPSTAALRASLSASVVKSRPPSSLARPSSSLATPSSSMRPPASTPRHATGVAARGAASAVSATPQATAGEGEGGSDSDEGPPTGGKSAAPKRLKPNSAVYTPSPALGGGAAGRFHVPASVHNLPSAASSSVARKAPDSIASKRPGGALSARPARPPRGFASAVASSNSSAADSAAGSLASQGTSVDTASTAGLTVSGGAPSSARSSPAEANFRRTGPIPACPSLGALCSAGGASSACSTLAATPSMGASPAPGFVASGASSAGTAGLAGRSSHPLRDNAARLEVEVRARHASPLVPPSRASSSSSTSASNAADASPSSDWASDLSAEAKAAQDSAANAKAAATAVKPSALSQPLVDWARRSVLDTLNTPSSRSSLHDGIHADGPRGAVFADLQALLTRTVDGIENVSTLLVGPRGAGKHRLLSSVLRHIDAQEDGGGGFLRVDLHPMLVPDEPTALMFIANQLRVMHSQLQTKGSFCDALRYLLHLLRRARPGVRGGEEAAEGQSQPVVFVLHAFEEFTMRPKQTLLYSLFDLMQTEDAQMAVIGLTTRIDVADLLEKRVRSRCSQRQMWLPALDTPGQCAKLLANALELPLVPAGTSPIVNASPEQAKRFTAAWAAQVKSLCVLVEYHPLLRKRLSMGITPQQVHTAVRLMMSELAATHKNDRCLATMEMLGKALSIQMVRGEEQTICDCSVVELLLLLCLKKQIDKELPPPHTLSRVLREYDHFTTVTAPQYKHPKPLLVKSFEHLCALGLVSAQREPRHRGLPSEQLPLRLVTDPQTLYDWVQAHNELPLEVRRFGIEYTL